MLGGGWWKQLAWGWGGGCMLCGRAEDDPAETSKQLGPTLPPDGIGSSHCLKMFSCKMRKRSKNWVSLHPVPAGRGRQRHGALPPQACSPGKDRRRAENHQPWQRPPLRMALAVTDGGARRPGPHRLDPGPGPSLAMPSGGPATPTRTLPTHSFARCGCRAATSSLLAWMRAWRTAGDKESRTAATASTMRSASSSVMQIGGFICSSRRGPGAHTQFASWRYHVCMRGLTCSSGRDPGAPHVC